MNARIEKDDFIYALGQTLQFYGKELDKMQVSFWWTACGDRPVFKLKNALLDYVKHGKYAPKPSDILGIVDSMPNKGQPVLAAPEKMATQCPPDIAKAWMWFIGRCSVGSKNMDGLFSASSDIDTETQERYLHVVNHEAHKYGTPDAIPDEYRLAEVWG